MKKKLFAMLAMAAALSAATAYADPVQIANAADWAAFANRVNNDGETNLDAVMTANVTLTQESPRVGTEANRFAGSFDGAGHTLTMSWNLADTSYLAPFSYVAGCTIRNLHTTGSITSSEMWASGLIGWINGSCTIEKCRCSATITSTVNGESRSCGFFGRTYWSSFNVTIRDCIFDGSLLGPSATHCGGFGDNAFQDPTIYIFNSLFAPREVTMSSSNSGTFAKSFLSSDTHVSDSYYTQTLGTAQGTDASSMSAEDLATALGENWTVSGGKAMLKVFAGPMVLSDGEIYTVANHATLQGEYGESAIAVADGARAIINVRSGATLAVRGSDASGTNGAASAIYVPEGSTLYIVGEGKLVATGGKAANGGKGGDGSNAESDSHLYVRGGAGGTGGAGGGGAAPAIGGVGGVGGTGGAGGDYTEWTDGDANGKNGSTGGQGYYGGGMGRVVILGDITVEATAGAAATSDGIGGYWGQRVIYEDNVYNYYAFGGGGGGGGARGQDAQYGIGGGGGGGAGGGGGGSGGTCYSLYDREFAFWGQGGYGGNSYLGTRGESGVSGGAMNTSDYDIHGGSGGNGGSANTTRGDNGTFEALGCAAMTVSPSRTAALPTAQSSGAAVAAPVTVTFKSDDNVVDTAQATLMFAPPAAPAASKSGYFFQGYYTAGGTKIYNANRSPVYPVWQTVEDTTLYARWEQLIAVTFVSEGGTVGTGGYAESVDTKAPIPQRAGDYVFQGYYTEAGVQVFDATGALVSGALSGLPSNVSLYAHWGAPEGSVVKLVYRGQLNLRDGGGAENDTAYAKKMHFRVYDGSEATQPLWSVNDQVVTVNADGSFVHAFGDEDLAALVATGLVTHVGLAIGESSDTAVELKPRRELRSVAAVNRALTAEGAAVDIRIGNLITENSLVAANATVSHLEVAGEVDAPGAGRVEVSPLTVGQEERTRLLRGNGVNVFSMEDPTDLPLAISGAALRGQVLATAPSDGVALVASGATGERAFRCPAVVQFCRKGESVRAPTSDAGGFKVTFFPFIGK